MSITGTDFTEQEQQKSKARRKRLECRILGGCNFIHENDLFHGIYPKQRNKINHREVCPICGAYRVVDHEPYPFDTPPRVHRGPDGRIFNYWAREEHMAWRAKHLV